MGLLAIAGALGFFMAFNNGANDVANAFASAVGAKAITMEQAVIIAGVMNLLGAVLLGGIVSSTLITEVISPDQFEGPLTFVAAMFAVLLASGSFVLASSWFGLPVSSSHAIVGSLVGVAAVQAGWESIDWRIIAAIAASWVISPVLAGALASALLAVIRTVIVRGGRPGMIDRSRTFVPYIVAATAMVMLAVLVHGGAGSGLPAWQIALALALVAPYLVLTTQAVLGWWTAGQPDGREAVEAIFRRLQVGTSSYVAFAHGANDVANAISPVFAVALVLTNQGQLPNAQAVNAASVPLWILVLGGVGIAVGVGALGGRVIATLAERVTTIDNTKGFCVDVSAASTVVGASMLGLPVSSTHAATGAIVGTGIWERGTIDLKVLGRIALAWVVTVPSAMAITVAIFRLICWGFDLGGR